MCSCTIKGKILCHLKLVQELDRKLAQSKWFECDTQRLRSPTSTIDVHPPPVALIITLITLISCLPSSSSSPKKVLLTLILALHLILALTPTGSRGKEARTTSLWLLTGNG